MERKKKVLFVCSANTCRSVMAEKILCEYGGDWYDASSAGLFAHAGEPMLPACAQALSAVFPRPVSYTSHFSRRLTADLLADSDIVCAVSEGYASLLRQFYPEYADKIVFFSEGISDLSHLSGEALVRGVKQMRDQIFQMFLCDGKQN